ncbi:MAG: hypothetical protein C0424_04980 [Sphingobacteriaceae bacterium]|nr:hypothetical protein [Sphingobacteriaceae bacterium]
MRMSPTRLYSILFLACLAGHIWFQFNRMSTSQNNESATICLFKQATDLPCPSCGTTRSVVHLHEGQFKSAWLSNPFGYLVLAIMYVAPIWIIVDRLRGTYTLWAFYHQTEERLKKAAWAIPLVLLVIINWSWNIYKGL